MLSELHCICWRVWPFYNKVVDCNLWQIITGSLCLSKCNLVSSETNLGTVLYSTILWLFQEYLCQKSKLGTIQPVAFDINANLSPPNIARNISKIFSVSLFIPKRQILQESFHPPKQNCFSFSKVWPNVPKFVSLETKLHGNFFFGIGQTIICDVWLLPDASFQM